MDKTVVGISDFICASPPSVLRTNSLGSCVCVLLYDPILKIGGLAHILLACSVPHSEEKNINFKKYADTAIPLLLKDMNAMGCELKNIKAMIFGGAKMFQTPVFGVQVGEKNIAKTREMLSEFAIPLIKEEVGGNSGRSVEMECATGRVKVFKGLDQQNFFF